MNDMNDTAHPKQGDLWPIGAETMTHHDAGEMQEDPGNDAMTHPDEETGQTIQQRIPGCGAKLRHDALSDCQGNGYRRGGLCRFVQGQVGLSMDTLDKLAECIGLHVISEQPQSKTRKGR
jgi:hypothetical protein